MNSKCEARKRIQSIMEAAVQHGNNVIVNALPGLGKTTEAAKLVSRLDQPVTFVTSRKDLYEQFVKMVKTHAGESPSIKRLPTFHDLCPTINGNHGDGMKPYVEDMYARGVSAFELHRPQNLPCQNDGKCPFTEAWDFDPDSFDLLIGNYRQLGNEKKVVKAEEEGKHRANVSRIVIIDEFPEDAFEHEISPTESGNEVPLNDFIRDIEEIPFDNLINLLSHKHEKERRRKTAKYLTDFWGKPLFPKQFDKQFDLTPQRSESYVRSSGRGHVYGAHAVAALVFGDELGNGFRRWKNNTTNNVTLFNDDSHAAYHLSPPDLSKAKAVIGLDGTPVRSMWETALQTEFREEQVLSDEERREYFEAENIEFYQTSEYVKPYSGGSITNKNLERDKKVIRLISDEYSERSSPVLISTNKAMKVYEEQGVLESFEEDDFEHFGNLKGTNKFANRQVGIILGSPHYGDEYVQKWGAYAGECIVSNDRRGAKKSYGEFGDKILTHMRENNVFQAGLRIARGDTGARVFFHTTAFPNWIDCERLVHRCKILAEGKKEVLQAVQETAEQKEVFTSGDVTDHVDDLGRRRIQGLLKSLAQKDVLKREKVGKSYEYQIKDREKLEHLLAA